LPSVRVIRELNIGFYLRENLIGDKKYLLLKRKLHEIMNMEIWIGREVVNNGLNINVPSSYSMVSRKHAKIIANDQEVIFEDLSSNGSWINNRSIKRLSLEKDAEIIIGDQYTGFKINSNLIFEKIKDAKNANKTDFTSEFLLLKQLSIDYDNESNRVKKNFRKKSALPQIIMTLGGMILFTIIGSYASVPPQIGMFFYIALPALGGYLIGMRQDQNALTNELLIVRHKYMRDFKCPKCKKQLDINNPITILEGDKVCPHKCGAVYVK
jgi:pSer/pThr/pTyr-binding forkhead associated (FHA) protein